MPRGVKKDVNYDDELKVIDEKIAKMKTKLDDLNVARAAIVTKANEAALADIKAFIDKSGKDPKEVAKFLQENMQ